MDERNTRCSTTLAEQIARRFSWTAFDDIRANRSKTVKVHAREVLNVGEEDLDAIFALLIRALSHAPSYLALLYSDQLEETATQLHNRQR